MLTDIASMLLDRVGDRHLGLRTRERDWTWDEVVAEWAARASLARALRAKHFRASPFHVGVLLDNVPDFVFWLGGAALAGATIVGLNPTRGTDALVADIRHADCQLIVTDSHGMSRLRDLDHGLDASRFLLVDDPGHRSRVDGCRSTPAAAPGVDEQSLFLLLFTSGTTGSSKAVKAASPGSRTRPPRSTAITAATSTTAACRCSTATRSWRCGRPHWPTERRCA